MTPLARFGTRLALGALRMLSWLPYPLLSRLGAGFGALILPLARSRLRIARINLRLCFPQATEAWRERIAREHVRFYSRSFFERFIFWMGSERRIRRLVEVRGETHLQAAMDAGPVILLAPHFVGMDAGGTRLLLDRRMMTLYSKQSNPVLNEVMTRGRARFNDAVLFSRQDGLRSAVRLLREGVPFYFLPDMDLGPRDAVFVPFFGVPAATVTALPRLAKMTGASVVPCVTTMTPHGYEVTLHPAWTGDWTDDVEGAVRRMNAFIEARVLEAPAQYLWTHKRFKTRPEGEGSFYRKG